MTHEGFDSFKAFRSEIVRHGTGGLSSVVEDIAEDIYHKSVDGEFDKLWDKQSED